MNVLVARSVAMPRRQTALKSAASALAMMAVGGVLSPSVAADWYYVGNPQNGVGFFQDSNSWVIGSADSTDHPDLSDANLGSPNANLTPPSLLVFSRSVELSNTALAKQRGYDGLVTGNLITFTINPTNGVENKVTLNLSIDDERDDNGALVNPTSLRVTKGRLILTQSNSYTGPTTIDAGATLQVGNGGTEAGIDSSNITLNGLLIINRGLDANGERVAINMTGGEIKRTDTGTPATLADGHLGLRGNTLFKISGDAKLNIPRISVGGEIVDNVKSGAILEIGNLNNALAVGAIAVGGWLVFNNTYNQQITTTITNYTAAGSTTPVAGDVEKKGAGVLSLQGTHTYTGITLVSEGTLKLLTANAIQQSSLVKIATGATLWMSGLTQSFKALQLDGGTLQGGIVNISGTDAAILSNGGTLRNISGGAVLDLVAGTAAAKRTTTLVTADATGTNIFGLIKVQEYTHLQVNSTTSSTSAVLVAQSGELQIGDATTAGFLNANINNGGTVILNNLSADFNRIISDFNPQFTGSLVKDGTSITRLVAGQTYTGTTTIKSGTLLLGLNNALSADSAVTIAGGKLDLGGNSQYIKRVNLASGTLANGTLGTGSSVTSRGGTIDTITATGIALSLAAADNVYNPLVTTMTGANTFGAVTINANSKLIIATLWGRSPGTYSTFSDMEIKSGGVLQLGNGTDGGSIMMTSQDKVIKNGGTIYINVRAGYGRRSFGNLDVTASFGFGQHWIGTDRTSLLGHGVSADFTGQTLSGRVEASYKLAENVRGFMAWQGTRFTAETYTEKGMAGENFGLTTASQKGAQGRVELGARYEDVLRIPDGRQIFLRSQIAWSRSRTATPDVNASFTNLVGSRFTVAGTSAGPDALSVATALELPLTAAISVGARVEGEWTNNSRGASGQASLSIRW